MKLLRTSIAVAAFVVASFPALAAPIPLSELSRYINSLTKAQTDFVQVNGDGSKSKGTLYISRPGRARFEYAPPEKTVVIAGGGQVAIFDGKSNLPPEQYPLRRTPLNLVLAPKVDLGKAKMVIGQREVGGTTRVLAQDPEHPEYGTIELVFSPNPTTLKAWIITDEAGNETEITLGPLVQAESFPMSLFDINLQKPKR
ncbi:outer membrane lipoprotein carrier protein LolA [Tabrizicola sp. J26]|uniref:LolA family protein n=1 Tax=Alitabrizicola rongguiensis TaxID=2909234 RepID=UPI001F348BEE|nr:outer membrane lipoprotein carrier protein LolA [Tabrizicola rongguiensis]MCF1710563.1 outer membrane lipoprotein carrier protein LolA [Tabrizicola rongguiensis]